MMITSLLNRKLKIIVKFFFFYSQKGNKTANERSDPNALKKAIADADRHNAKAIGSDDLKKQKGGGDEGAVKGAQRSISFTALQEPKKNYDQGPPRPRSSHGGRVQQSKACIILWSVFWGTFALNLVYFPIGLFTRGNKQYLFS